MGKLQNIWTQTQQAPSEIAPAEENNNDANVNNKEDTESK